MKEITLEITNKCLNKCIHCSSLSSEKCNLFLRLDQVKEVVEKYNPQWVNISGGEPLLHGEMWDILKYIKSKGIKIKLYTCGNIPNFEYHILCLREFIDTIVISYHSNNEDICNAIVGSTSGFKAANEAIKISKEYGLNIEVHIVPMRYNIDTLERTIEYLVQELKVNKINILKLVVQGRADKSLKVEDKKLISILNVISNKYSNKIRLGLPLNNKPCVAGKEKLVLMYNGKLIPCESYKDGICKCERVKLMEE